MWAATFNVLSVLGFFLSILAVSFAARSAIRVRELQDMLTRSPLSRVQSLETSLTDMQGALTEVANRVKMMKVRNAATHVPEKSSEPDPYKDPDGWRRSMNRRLADKMRGA